MYISSFWFPKIFHHFGPKNILSLWSQNFGPKNILSLWSQNYFIILISKTFHNFFITKIFHYFGFKNQKYFNILSFGFQNYFLILGFENISTSKQEMELF